MPKLARRVSLNSGKEAEIYRDRGAPDGGGRTALDGSGHGAPGGGRRTAPDGDGPGLGSPGPGGRLRCPLVIFLHGGFWRSAYDRVHVGPLSEALAAAGFAVCAPEYRRTGQPAGGWPGTFDDVAAAVDVLPQLAAQVSCGVADPDRVVLAGHSAGGHLALWAASRGRLPAGAPWHAPQPGAAGLDVGVGVVSLAGVCDLAACYRLGLGSDAAGALMGGSPEQFPERYRVADPMSLVPASAPAWLVHGTADDRVPDALSRDYAGAAAAAGGRVQVELLPGVGHFEVIDPLSAAWPAVLDAFRAAAQSTAGTGGAGPAG